MQKFTFFIILLISLLSQFIHDSLAESAKCSDLLMGQYYCKQPEINPDTQQPENCTEENVAPVPCIPVKGIECDGIVHDGETAAFTKFIPCKYTNGKKFTVALLLSIFLGWCGIDRFYLGYPAIGLLKFCTVGFMLLGAFVDIILIALQVVGPADGSAYVIDYYGAGLTYITSDNYTYLKPQDYS